MQKLALVGRTFFAVALIGLGIEHFIYRQFVTGRAPPWPQDVPGQVTWAFLSGAFIVLAGVMFLLGKKGRITAFALAALISAWAVLRNIPVMAASDVLSQYWTYTVKSLVLAGGSLAAAATFPQLTAAGDTRFARFANRDDVFLLCAKVCLAVFMVNNGIQHFLFLDFVASLIPQWFPGNAVFWTYFASAALFAGAVGIFYPRTASLAALLTGVMVFLWVWIVHVPRIFVSRSDNIAVFEALAVAGVALMLASLDARARTSSQIANASFSQAN